MAKSLVAAVNYPRLVPVRVLSKHSDHPWAGGMYAKSSDFPFSIMSKRVLTILLTATVLFPFSNAATQEVLIFGDGSTEHYAQASDTKSHADIEAAEEYEHFVERVESLCFDYLNSFSKSDDYYAIRYQAHLQKIILKISQGKFCSDPERLLDEMVYLRDVLQKEQSELKEESGNLKLHRLSRNLERELSTMIDELAEEILLEHGLDISRDEAIEYLIYQRQISEEAKKIYKETMLKHKELVEQIREAYETAKSVDRDLLTEEQIKVLENLPELLEEISNWALVVEIPEVEIPPVPEVNPQLELPPAPPAVVVLPPKEHMIIDHTGKAIAHLEYNDSIKVPSLEVPIFINSGTGELRVTGWNRDMLMVRFNVEIAAESERNAQSFADNVEVKLSGNDKGIYLKAVFPSLSDPKRRILLSSMDVKIPSQNSVVCDNSFGAVVATNLSQGIKLNTSYCDVRLDNISGDIEAVSKMNPLSVSNSFGEFRLVNSMGPITVTECQGELDIENSYSPVELTECIGPAIVRNSGEIRISDHNGKVTVENSNGLVEISDLDGDLIARNSYKPLSASDIRGSVELSNISSPIDIGDVSGQVTASNKFGTITGRYLRGPIEITNEAGTTILILHERMEGPSVINSYTGTVELDLTTESDILLSVRTEGGRIIGAGGNPIRKHGHISSTEMKFGRANAPLKVTAENSTVIIKGANDI
ncbi:MAG: hypothetical protein JSV52_07075 [Candidatus Zixiibacteriota bacterium]|nr:MAG: hypothetical protein JSV52_07075 [candidate division Zixibacteria bacterium]